MQELRFGSSGMTVVSIVTKEDRHGLLLRPVPALKYPQGVPLDIPGLHCGDTYVEQENDVILWFDDLKGTHFLQEQLSIIALKQTGYNVIDATAEASIKSNESTVDFSKFIQYKYDGVTARYYIKCEKCGKHITCNKSDKKQISKMFGRLEGYEKLPVCGHCIAKDQYVRAFGPIVIRKNLIDISKMRYKCDTCGNWIYFRKTADLLNKWNDKTETVTCKRCEIDNREKSK